MDRIQGHKVAAVPVSTTTQIATLLCLLFAQESLESAGFCSSEAKVEGSLSTFTGRKHIPFSKLLSAAYSR